MLVGVDIGTQSLKAAVLTPELELLGQGAVAYRPVFPRPGWAEQDPALWQAALGPAIAAALKQAGLSPPDIRALGIAGQLDGCVATGPDGSALHPCLIWMDRRAEAEVAKLDAGLINRRCGLVADPSHLAAKIRWLKSFVPTARQAECFHVPVSYVVSRLTGVHVIDHATASTSMVYDLNNRRYEPDLLSLFDIDPKELPEPRQAQEPAGRLDAFGSELTGLPKGVTVAVGTGDDFSSALGAGLVSSGSLLNVLGTAEVVGALHDRAVIDGNGLVETHAFPGGRYFVENPGWLSGGALAWFRDTFRLSDFAEFDALAAGVSAGSEGITFIPALTGAMAPEWNAAARGVFYGLTPAHGAGHMARAVLEGTAFAMRDVLERVISLGLAVDRLRIVGGGARSTLWRQIRADLTGLPAQCPRHLDTSPIGAAMLAGVAAGILPDLRQAAALLDRDLSVIEPRMSERSAYDEAYRRYRRLYEHLRPMF